MAGLTGATGATGATGTGPIVRTNVPLVYNNVILHESTRMPLGAAPNVRRAVVCGAQAAVMAFGRGSGANVYSWVEEMFDYGNQLGVAAGCISGITKTRFNGSDFGTTTVSTPFSSFAWIASLRTSLGSVTLRAKLP